MAYIRSRKHAPHSLTSGAAAALALMTLPAAVQAQPAPAPAAPPAPASASSTTLPEVKVKASTENEYKADKVSSPKFTQPLVDTPQTITVIKKEILQQQGATSLNDALRNTPGVTLMLGEGGNSNSKDNIFMRGFDTSGSVFVDGVRDLGNFSRDTFNLEQVEIIKGPSGSEYGRGAPSATINLSSKQPLIEDFIGGSVSFGTADQKRATADVNRRLGENSALRLNVMAQDSGVPGRNEVNSKRWGFAPSLALGLNTPTRTYFNFLHLEQDNLPDGGVPTVGLPGYYNAALATAGVVPPGPVNPENFYGSRSDFEKVEVDMFTARIEHSLTPETTLRNVSRIGRARHELLITGPSGVVSDDPDGNAGPLDPVARPDPATWTANRSRQTKWQENVLLTNQTSLNSTQTWGGLEHSLSAGVELTYEQQTSRSRSGAGTVAPANLWNPDINDPITGYDLAFTGAQTKGSVITVGAYAFDTIKLSDRWQLSGGLRLDKYRVENDSLEAPAGTPPTQAGTSLSSSDTVASGKIGVVFKPATNGSVYAFYSTSKLPPGGANFTLNAGTPNATTGAVNINAANLDPQEAQNVELGTKWELLDNRLAVTAAVYRSENKNDLAVADPVTGAVTQYGKKRVQGIELGVVGNITPAWSLSAGLAKMDTKVEEGTATQTGAGLNWSPELTFTAWTSYKLPFGLTVGGGARYVDSMVRSVSNTATAATTNMLNVPSYWVFDAMVAYPVNRNLTLQLNVYNLTDKFYLANLNNNGNRYTPGGARSALLSANLAF